MSMTMRFTTMAVALMVSLLIGAHSSIAQVSVPNTFSSGQTALASEVNANFLALVTAINDNVQQGTVSYQILPSVAADSSLTGRNVVVMRNNQDKPANFPLYRISVSYNDGANDIVDLIFVTTDAANTTITFWTIFKVLLWDLDKNLLR